MTGVSEHGTVSGQPPLNSGPPGSPKQAAEITAISARCACRRARVQNSTNTFDPRTGNSFTSRKLTARMRPTLLLALALIGCRAATAPSPLSAPEALERARAMHQRIITIDTHDDIPLNFATAEVDP